MMAQMQSKMQNKTEGSNQAAAGNKLTQCNAEGPFDYLNKAKPIPGSDEESQEELPEKT